MKGPAGTDTGRTSPTGYINLITKKPTLSDSFFGSVGAGSDSFKRASIDWNKALSGPDGIGAAFRLNAVAEDADVSGRDVVKNKRWGIAPSFAFGLNSPTRFYFDFVHIKQNNIPDGGVPTIGLPGYSNPDPKTINAGILRRETYRDEGARPRQEYRLTVRGVDLLPVIVGLMQWGDRHLAGPGGGPLVLRDRRNGQRIRAALVNEDDAVVDPRDSQPQANPDFAPR